MVDAEARAEHVVQAARHLHRQRYLGQQIEHLLALVDGFLYKVDVYLGLAARRYAVQQYYVLLVELAADAVLSSFLRRAERLNTLGVILAGGIQTAHFAMVKFEEVALNELAQYRI